MTPPWSDGWLPLRGLLAADDVDAASFGPPLPMIQSTLWSQPASPVSASKQQLGLLGAQRLEAGLRRSPRYGGRSPSSDRSGPRVQVADQHRLQLGLQRPGDELLRLLEPGRLRVGLQVGVDEVEARAVDLRVERVPAARDTSRCRSPASGSSAAR